PAVLQVMLLVWGTLVGLDLVSVPQAMIARPIVAGPIAGAILGDVATGLQLGVLFELFQYDILPVGAVRYPEYGPATIAAVSAALAPLARDYLVGTVSSRGRVLLSVAAVGVALAAGTAGTLRLVGRGPGLRWFAAGLVGGAAVVWLR